MKLILEEKSKKSIVDSENPILVHPSKHQTLRVDTFTLVINTLNDKVRFWKKINRHIKCVSFENVHVVDSGGA